MKANKFLLLAAALGLTPLLLFAQIDEKIMQSDITILQDVLNNLLSPADSPKQVSSRGLYLDGYGVIFNVNYASADHFSFPKNFEMKLAQENFAKAQQALATSYEQKAKAKEQQEKIVKEMERAKAELAQANKEMVKVKEEQAKVDNEMAKQRADLAANSDFQRALREERRVSALYEDHSDSISADKAREIIAGLQKNLLLFYADYAQGLRKLPASERITVQVNFERSPDFGGLRWKDSKSVLKDFYVSLGKSELPALRQSRSPESILRFQEAKTNEAIDRELEIFTGILTKAIGEQAGKTPWGGTDPRSMYVSEYGAIILLSSSYFNLANMEALKVYAEKASTGDKKLGINKSIPLPEDNWKQKLPAMKEQIIDQLARYGGSLRSLKSNENIMIVLSSQNGFWGDGRAPGISVTARMSDVNKIFNDEMNLTAFKNTLAIQE